MVEVTACGSITQGCCDDSVESGESLNVPQSMVAQLAAMGVIKDPDPKDLSLASKDIPVHADIGDLIEFLKCQVQPTGCFISEGPLCGLEIFYSRKLESQVYFNKETGNHETIPMGIQTTPYQPSQNQICAEAQFAAFELTPTSTSVEKIADQILGLNALTFDVAGNPIPVTIADLAYIKITPKQCDTLDSAGNKIELDFINVNGTAASDFVDLEAGGVDGATLIEVPVGGCAVVDVCFKKCWSKQEVAAL